MENKQVVHIEVHYSPSEVDELQLKDKNVVVIDVLRSCTTVATALQNGAKEIIPLNNIENAVKISGNLVGEVILRGGERNGRMIEGFDLGNSPQEYNEKVVKGKSIIYLTSNGTVAMVKGKFAKNLVIASFVNLSTVLKFLLTLTDNLIFICAGKDNRFCLEDTVCAGKIIENLKKKSLSELILDDGAMAALSLNKDFGKDILRMLKNSTHGKHLIEIGYEEDLKVCAKIDSVPVLPVLNGSIIRLKQKNHSDIK